MGAGQQRKYFSGHISCDLCVFSFFVNTVGESDFDAARLVLLKACSSLIQEVAEFCTNGQIAYFFTVE